MKSIYLFCTRPRVYLIEIPILAILWIAIKFNKFSENTFKFYPLIFVSAFFVIFIAVYFFRAISINTDEIRCIGLFSSKDNALIAENKTLVLSLQPNFSMKLELYTDASEAPAFEWMKASDVAHRDVCIFRAGAFGTKRSATRILEYFSMPKEVAENAAANGFNFENDNIKVESFSENEILKIKIKFKTTII